MDYSCVAEWTIVVLRGSLCVWGEDSVLLLHLFLHACVWDEDSVLPPPHVSIHACPWFGVLLPVHPSIFSKLNSYSLYCIICQGWVGRDVCIVI